MTSIDQSEATFTWCQWGLSSLLRVNQGQVLGEDRREKQQWDHESKVNWVSSSHPVLFSFSASFVPLLVFFDHSFWHLKSNRIVVNKEAKRQEWYSCILISIENINHKDLTNFMMHLSYWWDYHYRLFLSNYDSEYFLALNTGPEVSNRLWHVMSVTHTPLYELLDIGQLSVSALVLAMVSLELKQEQRLQWAIY